PGGPESQVRTFGAAKHRADQMGHRRLAVGASDAREAQALAGPAVPTSSEDRDQRFGVIDDDPRLPAELGGEIGESIALDDHEPGAGGSHRRHKAMSVVSQA